MLTRKIYNLKQNFRGFKLRDLKIKRNVKRSERK